MPHADTARLAAVIRRIGEDRADQRQYPRLVAQPTLPLVEAMAEVFIDDGMVLVGGDVVGVLRHQRAGQAMALREAHPEALAAGVFVVAAAGRAALSARSHADHVHRAVRRIVVGVAKEVLRGELPVRREYPFVHADHLGTARPPVTAIHHLVEMVDRIAKIRQEIRSGRVPGRPYRAVIHRQFRDFDQRPLVAIQRALVQRAVQRHALQPAIGGVAPGMVRADEQRGVALFVAAYLHAAMPAGVQEHVHRAGPVAAQDHQLLAHAGDEEVAGIGDLALVPDEQPGAGEQFLQFLAVKFRRHEDLAADRAVLQVDHPVDGQGRGHWSDLAMLRWIVSRRAASTQGQGSALKPAWGLCPQDPQQRRSLCNPSESEGFQGLGPWRESRGQRPLVGSRGEAPASRPRRGCGRYVWLRTAPYRRGTAASAPAHRPPVPPRRSLPSPARATER